MSGVKKYSRLMLLHCSKILAKMDARTHQDWMADENLRDAVCMRLMSLAECVKEYLKENPTLPDEFPHIPWDDIVRFRDKIAHHYEGIDYDIVWEILEADIQPLYTVISELADQNSPSATPKYAMSNEGN